MNFYLNGFKPGVMSHLSVLLSLLLVAPMVQAQKYPDRPIKLIVAFPPGGNLDSTARTTAQHLSVRMGQQVVVENRVGASGQIGMEAAAKAAPDGYTLILSDSSTLSILPSLRAKLPFDAEKDFTPIALVATSPMLFVVHPNVAAQNLPQLVTFARANPGKVRYGSSGQGTIMHLTGELLRSVTLTNIEHVPYAGGGPATLGLLRGDIELLPAGVQSTLQHIQGGKLRALAITSAKRHPLLPDVPTTAEIGMPDVNALNFFAVLGPARMPPQVVAHLTRELLAVTKLPAYQEQMTQTGGVADGRPPAQLATLIRHNGEGWRTLIKQAGISAQN